MLKNAISLLFIIVLFVIFGKHLFSAIGNFFYWIADLIESTGYISVWDKIVNFFRR